MLNIFDNDAFSVTSLTATVNKQPPVPGRIGQLGYFEEEGISTVNFGIEAKEGKLEIVASQPRGSNGQDLERDTRKLIPFRTVHLPQTGSVQPDEVQGVREFGSEDQTVALQSVIEKKTTKMTRNIDATMEYHRVGALKGQVLDKDGTTVLHDMHSSFGITKVVEEIKFGTTGFDIRNRMRKLGKISEEALGNTFVRGQRVLCGEEFYDKLIADPDTKEAFNRQNDGEFLRDVPTKGFYYAGVWWEEYAAKVNGKSLIDVKRAIYVPEGVPGLFITRFAPADYNETVNTIGLPYYAKSEPAKFGKGVDLEAQSNPINLCTVPGAVIELKL